MAIVIAQATHGSYPGMTYRLDAEQTGGSGNSRTVKITLYLKAGGSTTSSWYGYPVNWQGRIHSSYSGWQTVKGTESWNGAQGLRTFTYTATVDVGTTNSTNITVGFQTDSYSGDNSWDLTKTASFGVGSTNVAPTMPTSAPSLSPGGTIPENTATIQVVSPTASDGNGNLSGYRCRVSINGGGYTEVYRGAARDFIHNVQGYGEGTSFTYLFDAYDSAGAWSGNSGTATATKNVMTGGGFTGHSNDVGFDTTSFTLNFTGGKNTNGSGVTYLCYSDNVTVHNQQETTSGSQTITIWRSGAAPSGPYIKFDDLKNYFKNSNYNGRLHVGLRTRNNYGTDKWAGGSIGVDLRVNPNPARNHNISTDTSQSTIYKRVASSGNYYFIPDGSGVARVHWNGGSGQLGEAIRYEVYVAYGSGSWQKVADVAHSGGDYYYYNHQIGKQTVSQQFKYLIRTVTSYGWYSDAVTAAQTLHYYNAPGLTTGTITRGATTADVKVTIKSNSSIPNINTVGSWLTEPATVSGNLNPAQTEQNIALTKLTDSGTYTLKVTYNDNTGFSGNQVANIAIGQNTPLFFVNKFGAGVNGAKADSSSALSVNGITKSTNGVHIESSEGTANTSKSHSTFVVRSGNNLANRPIDYCTIFNIGANNNSNGQLAWNYNSGELDLRFRKRHDVSGDYGSWRTLWHNGNFNPDNKMDKDSVNRGWYRSEGATGWYSQTYGGGWHMEDTTWIRAYGGKSIYTSGNMRFDGNMSTGGLYLQKSWQQGQADCLRISNQKGYLTIAPQNDGHCHYETDRSNHWFNKEVQVAGDMRLYDGANNFVGRNDYGYQILDNGGTKRYVLWMDKTSNEIVLGLSNERYIRAQGHFCPWTTNTYWLGTNSPDRKWKGLCAEGGTVGASDANCKENMVRLDGTQVTLDKETNVLQEIMPLSNDFDKATTKDYYEFMKDRFKPTYYNYKLSKQSDNKLTTEERIERDGLEGKFYPTMTLNEDGEEVEQPFELSSEVEIEDEMSMLKNVGFLAQDYDLETDKVAREFIFETPTGELMYNHMSYATVGMVALQEAIKELELVKQENKQLKEDLVLIKEKLGL